MQLEVKCKEVLVVVCPREDFLLESFSNLELITRDDGNYGLLLITKIKPEEISISMSSWRVSSTYLSLPKLDAGLLKTGLMQATLSRGIQWNISRVTCIFPVYTCYNVRW